MINALPDGTSTSGLTPTHSQLEWVIGLTARPLGMKIENPLPRSQAVATVSQQISI